MNEVAVIDLDIPVLLLRDVLIKKFSDTPLNANIVQSYLQEDDLSDLTESTESLQRLMLFAGKLTVNSIVVDLLVTAAQRVIDSAEQDESIQP